MEKSYKMQQMNVVYCIDNTACILKGGSRKSLLTYVVNARLKLPCERMGSFGCCIMPVGRIANHYIIHKTMAEVIISQQIPKMFLIAESFSIEFMERAEKVKVLFF